MNGGVGGNSGMSAYCIIGICICIIGTGTGTGTMFTGIPGIGEPHWYGEAMACCIIICWVTSGLPSDMNDARRPALLSRRVRTSTAEADDGGVEYIDGGRDESRTLPVAMLGGRELPGDDPEGILSRELLFDV